VPVLRRERHREAVVDLFLLRGWKIGWIRERIGHIGLFAFRRVLVSVIGLRRFAASMNGNEPEGC